MTLRKGQRRNFARDTRVSVEKSQAEIGELLRRAGADQLMTGWEQSRALVGFRMQGRYVRVVVPMNAGDRNPDQVARERWRALLLVLRAKLEAINAGVVMFEEEFLAHIVLADGATVGQHVVPRLAEVYKTGKVPALLPAGAIQ